MPKPMRLGHHGRMASAPAAPYVSTYPPATPLELPAPVTLRVRPEASELPLASLGVAFGLTFAVALYLCVPKGVSLAAPGQ